MRKFLPPFLIVSLIVVGLTISTVKKVEASDDQSNFSESDLDDINFDEEEADLLILDDELEINESTKPTSTPESVVEEDEIKNEKLFGFFSIKIDKSDNSFFSRLLDLLSF